MHHDYKDIRDRIPQEPEWFDMGGIPRYNKFKPDMISNIYAHTAVLALISCQSCEEKFLVAMHYDIFETMPEPKALHYGDPPRHGDDEHRTCVGTTMNCNDLAVVEVWIKSAGSWERQPEYEGRIE